MGKFNNLDKYSNVDISEYIKNTTKQIQTGGPKLDANNNYDIENRKLKNVAEGTASSDAIKKHQLDTALIDKHDNDKTIDLKNTYNNRNRNTLVCYEDVRDVLVSRTESAFQCKLIWTWETIVSITSRHRL